MQCMNFGNVWTSSNISTAAFTVAHKPWLPYFHLNSTCCILECLIWLICMTFPLSHKGLPFVSLRFAHCLAYHELGKIPLSRLMQSSRLAIQGKQTIVSVNRNVSINRHSRVLLYERLLFMNCLCLPASNPTTLRPFSTRFLAIPDPMLPSPMKPIVSSLAAPLKDKF